MIILFWITLCVLAIVSELIFQNLISIWIAVGALFTGLTSIFNNNFYIQLFVFSSISLLFLITTKKWIENLIEKKLELEKTREFKLKE